MAKLFSIASWNVEHFKEDPSRVGRVVDFLGAQKPDVFALYEVEGAAIFGQLMIKMPGYTFQITEGPQTQEILVGVRKTITAFITQKIEYKSGTTHMRPGQLVTVTAGGETYAILFLHVASGVNPRGMGLRDDMIERALEFKKVLDKAVKGKAKYLFLGDLNSMGLKYPFQRDIPFTDELRKWDAQAARKSIDMRRLAKTHESSWSNGSQSSIPPSNLDHVYAANGVKFKKFKAPDGGTAEVDVRGWVDFDDAAGQDAWIESFSDHALLYLEVQA